jgi:hypothetical protein
MIAMRNKLILTFGLAAALLISADAANAQSRARTAAVQPAQSAQPCLKALDGSCVKGYIVEATRQRAAIISSVRVSYYGTPQGSIGGPYIPFERLFQDNDILFGLPTFQCAACVTFRSK